MLEERAAFARFEIHVGNSEREATLIQYGASPNMGRL